MEMKLKRYNPDFSLSISHELAYMRETPEGGYVDYRDYASLFSQFEALKASHDAQEQRFADVLAENARMKEIIDSVTDLDNEPEYHDCGMGCGLEDRGITDRYEAMRHGWDSAMERIYGEVIPNAEELESEFPATSAALAAIEARFCGLLDTYGKVEPERFNPEFADLYAKIVNRIFSSVMDNPSVTDLESLTDWLENSAENARAYADMSIKFHAELREGK